MAGNGSIICDAAGNFVAGYANTALGTTQPALVTAGSDYGTSPKAQIPKTDALGQRYAVPVSAGGVALPVSVNTYSTVPASAVGQISLGWVPSATVAGAGTWVPQTLDASGSGIIKQAVFASFSTVASVTTGTAANRSMLSFYNSGALYHRIVGLYAVCPPQTNTTGGLLGIGSGTTYSQVLMSVFRITGHSGGTSVTPLPMDLADTLDGGLTARFGATVTGEAAAPLTIWDAAYNASNSPLSREDMYAKVIVIPPNGGVHIKLAAALSSSVTFVMRAITTQSQT